MRTAGGYILHIPDSRLAILEDSIQEYDRFAEPVEAFVNRHSPIVGFVFFEKTLKHIAKAGRGHAAGTGLRRLNLEDFYSIETNVSCEQIIEAADTEFSKEITKAIESGGLLETDAFRALCECIIQIAPDAQSYLGRFSTDRYQRIAAIPPTLQLRLAEQKEALATAFYIADINRDPLAEFDPGADLPTSFLDGIPETRLREDGMLFHDMTNFPGAKFVRTVQYNAASFSGNKFSLTVILANRNPLEEVLGTDLIYFNETLRTFVVVQYKAMEKEGSKTVFRLPNEQLEIELKRMKEVQVLLSQSEAGGSPDEYRISTNPFYLKFCSRIQFNPDDRGLVSGMYFPIDYWTTLEQDDSLLGPQKGRRLTFENARRHLDNTEFSNMVRKGWIGTSGSQTDFLEKLIKEIVESGKAVALAIQTKHPDPRSSS